MKFRALEWNTGEADESDSYMVSAASPAGWDHYLTIGYEAGMFYPCWAIEHPGSASLVEMQALGQAFHEAKLKEMLAKWVEAD